MPWPWPALLSWEKYIVLSNQGDPGRYCSLVKAPVCSSLPLDSGHVDVKGQGRWPQSKKYFRAGKYCPIVCSKTDHTARSLPFPKASCSTDQSPVPHTTARKPSAVQLKTAHPPKIPIRVNLSKAEPTGPKQDEDSCHAPTNTPTPPCW